MKLRRIIIALALLAACTPEPAQEPQKPDTPVTPPDDKPVEESPYLVAKVDVKSVMEPGSTVTVSVRSNYDWAYSISSPLLEEREMTDSTLVLASCLNSAADETVSVTIMSDKDRSLTSTVQVKVKCGLLLDFVFDYDGTAHDASPHSYWIDTKDGVNMMTYNNASAGRTVARFFNSLGGYVTDGFYKFEYNSNTAFQNALADGHSLEVLFMLAEDPGDAGEIKMFSSMEQGGTGFLITDMSRGREITFLPNTTDAVGKNWRWCRSGVVPEVGKYYHAIGVWDKAVGKARIYIDGRLEAEVDAAGKWNPPYNALSQWICVGGDPSNSDCQSAWNGDVVLARVYDAVLDDAAVDSLWEAAPKNISATSFKIDNVLYMSECEVAPGGEFVVAGKGFKSGDKIILESSSQIVCETVLSGERAIATLPADIVSGTYKIYAGRGAESAPIGNVRLTVTDTPRAIHAPKVVAHRGFHGSGRPENSIAALQAAQDGGFYGSECDLWITTDGVIYVNHDGTIGGKNIQSSSSADLASVKLSNGEPLPTFQQYLDQAKKNTATRLVIEIKQHSSEARDFACTDEMLRMVAEAGLSDHVDYISFSRAICERIATARPGATVGYLSSTNNLSDLAAHGINCADFAYSFIFNVPSLFDRAHELGMEVNVWTVDSTTDMMRAIGLGTDYITTNKPDVLADIVARFF
ncbi:MAG: hypothetical protein J6X77_03555 [Bacteroidales bacterium]|nr:hypothetical protein [Bacteroidales bacterium]